MARTLISQSTNKRVYRDGDAAIKVFRKEFPKSGVLNDAIINTRIEELGGINIPAIREISVVDGCWSITRDFIDGKTLQELMAEHPENMDTYLDQMVDLQIYLHSRSCPMLNKLRDKMKYQISNVEALDPEIRYDLLTRLENMPKHAKLCHGDFCPENIIIHPDGQLYILSWVHATQGNASADVARTFLLLSLSSNELAGQYLERFCQKTRADGQYIRQWIPLVAAAQLSKDRPQEHDLLAAWANSAD